MKRILFYLSTEHSTYNASFTLAKALIDNNYEVIYIVKESYATIVELEGFNYHIVPSIKEHDFLDTSIPVEKTVQKRESTYFYLKQWFEKDKYPDLVIYTSWLFHQLPPFILLNIPLVAFHAELSAMCNDRLPPVLSGKMPMRNEINDSKKNKQLWDEAKKYHKECRLKIEERLNDFYGIKACEHNTYDIISKKGYEYEVGEYTYLLKVPQLVAAPLELDFCELEQPVKRIYMGACCYKPKNRPPFNWKDIPENKPIIYCSLGSHEIKKEHRVNFFNSLIKSIKEMPGLVLILTILEIDKINNQLISIPDNVFIFKWVNQHEVLSKTSLFLTHGGMSSVRESIYYGVPMIVFPMVSDQPGVSARIAFHKIGMVGRFEFITPSIITNLIRKIQRDKTYSISIKKMQKKLVENNTCKKGVEFINNYIHSFPRRENG